MTRWPTYREVKEIQRRSGRNLNFNGKKYVGFDKTNVECFNCHRRCHFAKKCMSTKEPGKSNEDNNKEGLYCETPAMPWSGKLNFEDVHFVKELKFNLFSVSQLCDKKNSVLFTETECLILSPDFKLLDESQVLFKVPRQCNMYSFDLKNVVPTGGTDISKIIRKPSKNGQARTRERKSVQKPEAKPRKVNLQSNWSNLGQP
ncbi:hypothetical protein Tco_0690510 [Tanacetum coccineum]